MIGWRTTCIAGNSYFISANLQNVKETNSSNICANVVVYEWYW